MADRNTGAKARRRADQELLATYHEARLAFQLDDIIHQYKRATIELWQRDVSLAD
jgi:hypothetical protein